MDDQIKSADTKKPDIGIGSSIGDLANISHQKGDVDLVTYSKDKIENMLSATGSLGSNFLFFMLGSALSIFLALKSGGVEAGWRPIFWIAFIAALILATFFGAFTVKQEIQKHRYRKELRKKATTT